VTLGGSNISIVGAKEQVLCALHCCIFKADNFCIRAPRAWDPLLAVPANTAPGIVPGGALVTPVNLGVNLNC
jgi:hypothetical protein